MPSPLAHHSPEQLRALQEQTLSHYEQHADRFWEGTKDHDVSQNIEALLRHLDESADILDLGCGPGRDLRDFVQRGHRPVGVEGALPFVQMARSYSGCEVWHQNFLALDLPPARFDGIFANAVLFHVPSQSLADVLDKLRQTLRPDGVLFCSNPRGPDIEQQNGARFGCYLTLQTWREFVENAGFSLLEHYYRPPGRPRSEQPWLATVFKR